MNLTPQSFEECNSAEQLNEMWVDFLDMLFDDDDMTEEFANELLQAFLAASKRLSPPQAGVILAIPEYLIIGDN